MKTISVNLYSIQELKEQFPDGYKSALEHWQNRTVHDIGIPWQDETIDSLKTLLKDAGVTLRDWSLGAYNRGNHISISFPHDDCETLHGKRALAWLENNLLCQYRAPFVSMMGSKKRREFVKYGRSYSPGSLKPCPITGYCADDEYLESLHKSLRSGDNLREAFEHLASVCMDNLERDAEAQASEDYFVDHVSANDYEFTEDGEQA